MSSNAAFASTLGGAALIAGLLAVLSALGALQQRPDCCGDEMIDRVAGPVKLVLIDTKPGGRFQGLVGGKQLKIRMPGEKSWFVYDDGWPNFPAIRDAIRQHTQVTLDYANCRKAFGLTTYCDAVGVATADAGTLVRPGAVRKAKADRHRDLLIQAAVLGIAAACFAGVGLRVYANGLIPETSSRPTST